METGTMSAAAIAAAIGAICGYLISRFGQPSAERQTVLAVLIIGALVGCTYLLIFRPIPAAADSDALKLLIGALISQATQIIQYDFGASRGGSANQEAMRRIATGEATPPVVTVIAPTAPAAASTDPAALQGNNTPPKS